MFVQQNTPAPQANLRVFGQYGLGTKGGKYLVCYNGQSGAKDESGERKCERYSVRYDEFEATLLANLRKLRPDDVLPNPDEQAEQAKQLREAIAGVAGELDAIEKKIGNLVDQIANTSNALIRARYEQGIEALEAKKPELEAQRVKHEIALSQVERGAKDFAKWQKSLAGLKGSLAEDIETRIRLKAHLKEFIEKVEIFAKGHEDTVDQVLDAATEAVPELERSKHYGKFIHYVEQEVESPRGRFYRLFVKTAKVERTDKKGRKYSSVRDHLPA